MYCEDCALIFCLIHRHFDVIQNFVSPMICFDMFQHIFFFFIMNSYWQYFHFICFSVQSHCHKSYEWHICRFENRTKNKTERLLSIWLQIYLVCWCPSTFNICYEESHRIGTRYSRYNIIHEMLFVNFSCLIFYLPIGLIRICDLKSNISF